MAQIDVEFNNETMYIRSQGFSCEFPEVDKNKKAILVFLRSLCVPETGKPLFTYQQLADAFEDGVEFIEVQRGVSCQSAELSAVFVAREYEIRPALSAGGSAGPQQCLSVAASTLCGLL